MRDACGSLKHHWYVACTAAELGTKRPLGRQVLGELLVLYRDGAGRPVVLKDRCLHRNALLSEGTVADGCVSCPYHGWAYDALGQVVGIPSEGPERRVRPGRRLERFEAREQDGLIWVYMGDGEVRAEPRRMPYWREDGYRAYYMVTPFANNVTNLVENFMDVPHTVFVHAGWFRTRKAVAGEAIVKRTEDSVEVTYLHEDQIGFASWLLNPEGHPMVHTDRFFMPNVTQVDYHFGQRRHFVIASQITPVDPWRSMVYTAIAFRLGPLTPLFEPLLRWYTRQVIAQDVQIMANQGRSLRHHGATFQSTEADAVHLAIERLRTHAESGGSGPPPAPEERRIRFWI